MTEPVVYDKAKYHYEGDYPEDLPEEQAFVHAGMFLGWIIDHDLYSEEFQEDNAEQIDRFKRREMTGPQLYEYNDGVLVDDMLSDEGNSFAQYYFDFEKGAYIPDYERLLATGLPGIYHVQDTWDNYLKLKGCVDERYLQWKRTGASNPAKETKAPFWKRWLGRR